MNFLVKQNTCFMTDGISTLFSYPFHAILRKKKRSNIKQISQVHAVHMQWGLCRSLSWSPPCHMGKTHCENTMLSPLPHRHVGASLVTTSVLLCSPELISFPERGILFASISPNNLSTTVQQTGLNQAFVFYSPEAKASTGDLKLGPACSAPSTALI